MARLGRAEAGLGQQERARQASRSFTADDGRYLARLAGAGLSHDRNFVLRRGYRPVHTRGVLVEGRFTSNGAAGSFAPDHLADRQVHRVWGRFSSCSADLEIDDRRLAPRGLAVRMWMADGRSTDLVAMSLDRFPANSRDAFVSISNALTAPLPVRAARVLFLAALRQFHGLWATTTAFAPSSYSRCDYYCIHTFVWRRGHEEQPVRYRWKAEDGRERILPWRGWGRRSDYLRTRLIRRLHDEHRAIRFDLQIQAPRDVPRSRLADVGRPLPRRVKWQSVGRLELERVVDDPDEEMSRDGILFSPLHLIEGIDVLPEDEIITARAAAYPASHVARSRKWP